MAGAQLYAWQKSFEQLAEKHFTLTEHSEADISQLTFRLHEKERYLEDIQNQHEAANDELLRFEQLHKEEELDHRRTKKAFKLLEGQIKDLNEEEHGILDLGLISYHF